MMLLRLVVIAMPLEENVRDEGNRSSAQINGEFIGSRGCFRAVLPLLDLPLFYF